MQKARFLLLVFLSLWMAGCTLEEARVPAQRHLVIASDYLSAEDERLFEKFSRHYDIDLRIVQLDAQLIYSQLRQEGPESEIDLILLESEFDVHRLAVEDLLQPWPKDFKVSAQLEKYASSRYHFVGFALDPYVITAAKGSNPILTYKDLTHQEYSDELSEADRINLLSPVCDKMDKGKTEVWINNFVAHGRVASSESDSILTTLPRLMKRSTYYALKSQKGGGKMPAMRILTSGKKGSFYNLRTFCMAQQCPNYTEALLFTEYFLKSGKNRYLSTQLRLVPATQPGKVFRPYKVSTGDLLPLHTLVERMLEKLGNR